MTTGTTDEHSRLTTQSSSRHSLTVSDHIRLPDLTETRFAALVFEQEIPHTAKSRWETSSCSLEEVLEYALATSHSARTQSALLDLDPLFGGQSLAHVTLRGETTHCMAAAAERAVIAEIESWLQDRLPATQPTESREIPVRFWSCGTHGASSVSRRIAVPGFDEIRDNYPCAVRERLERLVGRDFQPADGGQLILWHGPPGTGKTYALRALGWEWRNWCELYYVIDPEVFFGQRADYMLDVVLDEDTFGFGGERKRKQERKWRLLVLEDTGELLAADAKERTGQGLSRLLNLVDGIVGQGLRVLVLVTTNEPVRRLHPAVARPGRCAAQLQFTPFSDTEAAAWLAERGITTADLSGATLAELFAHAQGQDVEQQKPLGFGT